MSRSFAIAALAACSSTTVHDGPDSGPDAPAAAAVPDLRFKFVGAFDAFSAPALTTVSDGQPTGSVELSGDENGAWSPFELGDGDAWRLYEFIPATAMKPMSSKASAAPIANAASDLAALPGDHVITALDFSSDAYAAITDATLAADPHNQFSVALGSVAPADLGGYVAAQAASRSVVTAFAWNGTAVTVASYALHDDAATYESSTAMATTANLGTQAAQLASAGYVITAIGRVSTTDYALVGTRLAGNTAARTAMTLPVDPQSTEVSDAFTHGFVIVGSYFDGHATQAIVER